MKNNTNSQPVSIPVRLLVEPRSSGVGRPRPVPGAVLVMAACLLAITLLVVLRPALAGNADLKYQPIIDPKTGMVMAQIPLPANWRLVKKTRPDQASIEGPEGIRVLEFASSPFMYTSDPYMQQMYQASGQPLRRPPGSQAIMEQELAPLARKEGMHQVRQYRIPELADKNRAYDAQLYKVAPTQGRFEVLATEWEGGDSPPSLIILNYNELAGGGLVTWYYTGYLLEAPAARFKPAKKTLINALVNTRYNPQHIQAVNQREMQKAQASMTAHQRRMQNNQAAFEATQRSINESNNAVNNALMGTWRSNNASQDRIQRRSVNAILDENTVYDAGTGNAYQVESGADQYWMNDDREYIPSNDAFYNPNMDPAINQQEWREVEIQY